jgi:hypothetical protein
MNYSKPEITSLASASFVIQGNPPRKGDLTGDGPDPLIQSTPAAYEADE